MSNGQCSANKCKQGQFYGVVCVGVYNSWDVAWLQVDGYPGAEFKRFATAQEARAYVMGAHQAKGGCLT